MLNPITKIIVAALFLSVLWNGPVYAASISEKPWLSQGIAKSQIIVIAKIVSVQQESQPGTNDAFADTGWSLAPPSLYTCRVLQQIKGQCALTLQVHLPRLVSLYYGRSNVIAKTGDDVLLLLQTNQAGDLKAVVSVMPLIRLSNQQSFASSSFGTDPETHVVQLLLDSLADLTLRVANITALQGVVAPEVVAELTKYIDDPDPNTRSAVLGCLAVNQQVSVIPRIIQLAAQAEKQDPENVSWDTSSLADFDTPEATSYLNLLIVNPVYLVRTNAIVSLRRSADQTSIPYLVLALRDSDYQKFIPSVAWRMLHKVVPVLGSTFGVNSSFFYAHRETETEAIYDWWSDELMGKHVPNTPEGQQILSRTLPADAPLAVLNTALFEPSTKLRRTAMYRLQKSADTSSFPYLVLALQDPDGTVAYEAYVTLHQLVPSLGQVQAAEAFGAGRGSVTAPVYAWWSDYLGGIAPVIPLPPGGLVPLPDGK